MHIFVLGRHLGFSNSEGVGVKWRKWARGEGEGKKKYAYPQVLFVCKTRTPRWTGVLIGAVGCNLIDACQSKVVFLPADSLIFDDALTEAFYFCLELAMSRVLRPGISSLVHGSDLLAVLPTGFGKSLIFQLLIRDKTNIII